MKKIICSMMAAIVFLLSPLSAFASTTESMLMYASVEDDYSVMPLADIDNGTITIQCGYYSLKSDRYVFEDRNDNVIGVGNISYGSLGDLVSVIEAQSRTYSAWNSGEMPCYKISFTADNFGVINQPLMLQLTRITFDLIKDSVSVHSDQLSFYDAYADIRMAGTIQVGSAHMSVSGDSTDYGEVLIPLQPFLSQSSYSDDLSVLDLKLDLTVPNPDKVHYYDGRYTAVEGEYNSNDSWSTYQRFYNSRIYQIDVYFVLDLSSAFNPNGSVTAYNNINNFMPGAVSANTYDGSKFYVVQRDLIGTSDDNIITSVSNKISSMGNSISSTVRTQINSVKTQMTQNTNAITTRIQTMETNVVDGLNNVIESAKTNTQNIINTVTQKVDEVKTGISEVKDSILDLPNKLQEMLLGLIVPDSDTMADKYSEFSGLLEEKLGVIYQIPMMLFDFFDTIVNAATTPQTTLTLPAFQLPWIDGSTLTVWQPMEYKIIPEGMQVLSDLIKTITSMTVVVLTFNSVKRAYERFLRS